MSPPHAAPNGPERAYDGWTTTGSGGTVQRRTRRLRVQDHAAGGGVFEAKYDPAQPRWPAGRSDGGQWRAFLHRVQRRAAATKLEVDVWIARNPEVVTRVAASLQLAGGAAEVVGGIGLVGAGVATSEVGVGIAVAGVGAWAVRNGFDNLGAARAALLTGQPQDTNLRRTLLAWGLTDAQATATEVFLAGGTGVAGARLSQAAIRTKALAELERRALLELTPDVLPVSLKGRSIWDEPSIVERGLAWERYDQARTGYRATPPNYPVIDQISRDGLVVVSNKTIDVTAFAYSRADRNGLLTRMRAQVDSLARLKVGPEAELDGKIGLRLVREKRLNFLLPAGEVMPGQALQIAAAHAYARERGVVMTVEYAL